MGKSNILGINGSASPNSSNLTILKFIKNIGRDYFNLTIIEDLSTLPHFKPEQSSKNTPMEVLEFRKQIEESEGIIIVKPEYVFSIPSRLKNAIEWSVSETVFSDKATGLITESANDEEGHKELKMIMKTLLSVFTNETTLLIKGAKGKTSVDQEIIDLKTKMELDLFVQSFVELIKKQNRSKAE